MGRQKKPNYEQATSMIPTVKTKIYVLSNVTQFACMSLESLRHKISDTRCHNIFKVFLVEKNNIEIKQYRNKTFYYFASDFFKYVY